MSGRTWEELRDQELDDLDALIVWQLRTQLDCTYRMTVTQHWRARGCPRWALEAGWVAWFGASLPGCDNYTGHSDAGYELIEWASTRLGWVFG